MWRVPSTVDECDKIRRQIRITYRRAFPRSRVMTSFLSTHEWSNYRCCGAWVPSLSDKPSHIPHQLHLQSRFEVVASQLQIATENDFVIETYLHPHAKSPGFYLVAHSLPNVESPGAFAAPTSQGRIKYIRRTWFDHVNGISHVSWALGLRVAFAAHLKSISNGGKM